jgi:hypothetical protein
MTHYKNILHFKVDGVEVLNMNIQGATNEKASEIARDTIKGNQKLFGGKVVEVSIEFVYVVPDGSGCVDFEFDLEKLNYKNNV